MTSTLPKCLNKYWKKKQTNKRQITTAACLYILTFLSTTEITTVVVFCDFASSRNIAKTAFDSGFWIQDHLNLRHQGIVKSLERGNQSFLKEGEVGSE